MEWGPSQHKKIKCKYYFNMWFFERNFLIISYFRSSRERLIETREQELDQLQTNLSLKRTRNLREEEIRLRTFVNPKEKTKKRGNKDIETNSYTV